MAEPPRQAGRALSRFDSASSRAARQSSAANQRAAREERKAAYLARTPDVLLDAQRAAFTRAGCTPAQKRLLHNWVSATINDADLGVAELLVAALDASRSKP